MVAITMPPRHLDDGQRDAKEAQDRGADEIDDGEEQDGVDGDASRQGAIDGDGRSANEAKEDERRAEGIDQRQERAEREDEVFPDQQHWVMGWWRDCSAGIQG